MNKNDYSKRSSENSLIRPMSPANEEHFKEIEAMCIPILVSELNLGGFSYGSFYISTIATVVLDMAIKKLSADMLANGTFDIETNINEQLFIHPSYRKNVDYEKEGNINIVFDYNKDRFSDTKDLVAHISKVYNPENPKMLLSALILPRPEYVSLTEEIDKLARKELITKYNIRIATGFVATTIFTVFLTSMIQYMTDRCETKGKGMVINFNQITEVNCDVSTGETLIRFTPGEAAKLAIKMDSLTEVDDD